MLRREFNLTALSIFGALGSGAVVAQEETQAIVIPDMSIGDENAPVKIIEYASFTCPHCAAFHKDVFGQLKTNYIDTGKVHFTNREVYFDRLGLWAALLARCGDGSRYFGLSDMIYEKQREWTAGESGAVVAANLYKIGRIAGMQDEEMEACLQNREQAEAMVARFKETTEADNVSSTPTLIINGKSYTNMSYDDLAKVVDEAIES